ncbi:MAG: potassium uptake protein, TrkH family [Defluviitaleaceae bacterium]|nr:potassium uptake protein, TrkH family [Defluviitaleaceae bacterium]
MKITKLSTLMNNFTVHKRKRLNPAKVMFLGYLSVILTGAVLLALPISHHEGADVNFLTALFTSTSATSVTGLVVADTSQTWSVFGRIVILCLIQIGALGFMTFTTIFFFIMNRKIGLSQRLLIMQSLNLHDMKGVIRLIRHVLLGTLMFQGIGAILLWLRFMPRYGAWQGLGMAVFHSIAAFANAGFDLFGYNYAFHGLSDHAGDGFVITIVMLLAIIGGLGFFVWEDILQSGFRFKRLHLHSKLVLCISFWLILAGWIFFFVVERNNPYTIGDMSLPNALHISLFQVIMPRSAGFSVVGQGQLLGATKMIIMLLMLIGGSAGSTAGGIKNVTAGILFLSAINYFRGKSRLAVFGRTIPTQQIRSALAISMLVLCAAMIGAMTISLIQPYLPFSAVLFETISAIATCGLSYGITSSLAPASQIVLILFMFCGRVGIMTLGMVAFFGRNNDEKIKHPETWVIMG